MTPTTNTEGAVTDVAAIAAKLTKDQRKALAGCWCDPKRHGPYHAFASTPPNRKAWREMLRMGFVSREDEGFDFVVVRGRAIAMVGLTPLATAVRNHLTEQGVTAS